MVCGWYVGFPCFPWMSIDFPRCCSIFIGKIISCSSLILGRSSQHRVIAQKLVSGQNQGGEKYQATKNMLGPAKLNKKRNHSKTSFFWTDPDLLFHFKLLLVCDGSRNQEKEHLVRDNETSGWFKISHRGDCSTLRGGRKLDVRQWSPRELWG